jgi:hypothetical protein
MPDWLGSPQVLREYALLADGERGIVLGPRGDVVWMCFPRWESGSVFSSLIGGRGLYAISPVERCVWGGHYEDGTLIWRNRWTTDGGAIIECREALALPSSGSRAVVLRRLLVREGRARVRVALVPRGAYDTAPLGDLSRSGDGCWHGRVGDAFFAWRGAAEAREPSEGDWSPGLTLELDVAEGEHHDFVLTFATSAAESDPPDPDAAWAATEAEWQTRVPDLSGSAAPRDARQACAVLSGLTSESGGMVAAATTGLPERAREGRNYDYRYAWIRDQCYTGQAAARAGVDRLLDSAVAFVSARVNEHGRDLRPAYTTTGDSVPGEHRLDLPGYPGGDAVIGNSAKDQFQLDSFGEVLLLLAAAAERQRLDHDGWHAVELAAAAIEERWQEPDAGIWELDPHEWTHSRLICAAGLRAAAAQAPAGELPSHWLALADAITAATSARALHPSGRWQRSPDDERLDVALLLPPLRGAIPADDRRTTATLASYTSELTSDGYAYRYRVGGQPLGTGEGAFLLCGFILTLAHAQQGDQVAAARWFERHRAACGPPGLYSEEYDVVQRQLRGNLPQAFVHALLLECSATLETHGPVSA